MRDEAIIEAGHGARKFSVLIVDDALDDRFLVKRAIHSITSLLTVVGEVANGVEAIAYLSGNGRYGDRQLHPIPDVLLLDLRMPLQDGFDVLAWLRNQRFPALQVMILTNSLEGGERERMLELGVKRAFLKPWRFEALTGIVRMMESELLAGAA